MNTLPVAFEPEVRFRVLPPPKLHSRLKPDSLCDCGQPAVHYFGGPECARCQRIRLAMANESYVHVYTPRIDA
jgi:hypothetical protein